MYFYITLCLYCPFLSSLFPWCIRLFSASLSSLVINHLVSIYIKVFWLGLKLYQNRTLKSQVGIRAGMVPLWSIILFCCCQRLGAPRRAWPNLSDFESKSSLTLFHAPVQSALLLGAWISSAIVLSPERHCAYTIVFVGSFWTQYNPCLALVLTSEKWVYNPPLVHLVLAHR